MRTRTVASLALALLGLAALGAALAEAQKLPNKRVALVLPGSINDQGFGQSAYNGLGLIQEKLGVKTAFSESTAPPKYISTLTSYASQGYDAIVAHGFEFGDPVMKMAGRFPKVRFFVNAANHNGDGKLPNVASLQPAMHEGAYVAGTLAGLTTKTNRVGVIGAFPFPSITSQLEAFRDAVKAVNPVAKVTVVYINTLEDVTKGKEAALAQISAGADVLYHVADHAGLGILQAAEEKGVTMVHWGLELGAKEPPVVIATHVIHWDQMWVSAVSDWLTDGKFKPGIHVFPMKSGITDLVKIKASVPAPVKDRVMKVRTDIIEGKFTVPFHPKPRPN